MPSNKYTQQPPIAGASTKVVLASRAYMGTSKVEANCPNAKLSGADPSGWTDLGIVADSKVNFTYTKEIKPIETGIEKIRRGSYSMAKSAQCTFTLEQYDLDTLTLVNGLTINAVTGGGKMFLGQDDIIEKSLFFVGTNKVDGKEHQMFVKNATLSYNVDEEGDMRVLKVTADLYAFTPVGETVDAFVVLFVFD